MREDRFGGPRLEVEGKNVDWIRSSFTQVHKELGIYLQAVADWRSYASDVLIEHIVLYREALGGGVKRLKLTSEIGKENTIRGSFRAGTVGFGCVERERGRCFLVAVHDRTEEILLGLIESWTEPPGMTAISDC
ncbi:hypothetical protein TNCV_1777581 [Trichonephila clavipes]|nr:hypothetical protein TNCV_1777581 [Trichonephila clavipes]